MNNAKNAVDRIRPFIQEMERSINVARQRRLNGGNDPVTPPPPVPPAAEPTVEPGSNEEPVVAPQRLRARPKRPDGHAKPFGDSFRSQAG